MLLYVARRLLYGVGVVVATAFFAYGGMRFLKPNYPTWRGEPWGSGTWHDVTQTLLHLNAGESCMYTGCPKLHDLWTRGLFIDVTLLGGALLLGGLSGVAAGRWCASHRGSVVARGLEALAMLGYCAPPYLVGYLALMAFDPYFGVLPLPVLIDAQRFGEPFPDAPHYFAGMLLPWLVCAAPVAAASLRLTLGLTAEAMDEDYVRTALAKGLSPARAIRRHATPGSRVAVASYIGAAIPTIVLNVVLVEFVFALPGFFAHTWRAFGKAPGYPPPETQDPHDYPTLQAIAVWASVLIVVVSIAADLLVNALDPRIRASGRA
jgi:peptide/nickel transport system permease protein